MKLSHLLIILVAGLGVGVITYGIQQVSQQKKDTRHVSIFEDAKFFETFTLPNGRQVSGDYTVNSNFYGFRALVIESDIATTREYLAFFSSLNYVTLSQKHSPLGHYSVVLRTSDIVNRRETLGRLLEDLWHHYLPDGVVHFPTEYGTKVYIETHGSSVTIHECEGISDEDKVDIKALWVHEMAKEAVKDTRRILDSLKQSQ